MAVKMVCRECLHTLTVTDPMAPLPIHALGPYPHTLCPGNNTIGSEVDLQD